MRKHLAKWPMEKVLTDEKQQILSSKCSRQLDHSREAELTETSSEIGSHRMSLSLNKRKKKEE